MNTSTQPERTTTLTDRLCTAIAHAVRAPSSHNTQPWLFRLKSGEVELLALKQATAVRVLDLACPVFCGAAVTVPGYLDALVRHR